MSCHQLTRGNLQVPRIVNLGFIHVTAQQQLQYVYSIILLKLLVINFVLQFTCIYQKHLIVGLDEQSLESFFLGQVDIKSIGSLSFMDLFYPLCRYTKLFLPPKTFLIFALFYADDTVIYAAVSSLNIYIKIL